MTIDLEPLRTPQETSKVTRATLGTLAKWRCERRAGRKRVNLPFVKIGGKVLYKVSDVREFIASRTVTPGAPQEKPRRRKS
jgi:hypothetical protein